MRETNRQDQFASTSPADGPWSNLPVPSRAALFLDFDGTLAELAERHDEVVVPPGTETMLFDLRGATGGALAIVSGRSLGDLERMLPGFDGILIGSHGAERRVEGKRSGGDREYEATLASVRDGLVEWSAEHDGVLLEEKPASLVLHFRRAPDCETACRDRLDAEAQRLPGFVVRPSKMAFELMPETVSKRDAISELLTSWPDRVPVAIGDDHTDEGMFAAAMDHGGHGIKVGDGDTQAAYRLRDVSTVHAGLRHWLEQGKDKG